ncbi:UpxZ family transcription anti-terminator antagonist [uncultured Bacteroides sp.]|uniref:UpxZ family transcription anti-terminator antagonist n=1 Tax=uncultured Bacteroides sp. TaxID=162156 RepID=UPI002586DBFE|nr:UpxZ family transcription anti-terminator antagonist [uncultured Bacteroides sp.]
MKSQIDALRQLTHELLYLGMDGEPIYADRFRQLNSDVYNQAEALYWQKARNDEEEATLCVTLLKAYSATIYDRGDKGEKVQILLDRSWEVLNKISDSLLKCQLLVACYGETFDEELAKEVCAIMDGWGDSLTVEQQELLNEFIP